MNTLETLESAMEVCDPDLRSHAERVAAHAEAIARRLGWSEAQLDELAVGAALHDVGKVAVPREVLTKPGALEPIEMEHIRAHPVEGAWLLSGIPMLTSAIPYVLFHHERWDGTGYPTRRAGTGIPLAGRLLAVADAFDAMTSSRPYRDARSIDYAIEEVDRNSGSQFDPEIVRTLVRAWDAGEIAQVALANVSQ
jgi:HD-GYP domain-containing protein (c-di-GMP phosphodiesterase class II)